MAIDIGGPKKQTVKPAMNITPLVDVVLVLLIIFMVVTPLLTKQFWVQIPKKDDKPAQPNPDDRSKPVVLTVDKSGSIKLNAEAIEKQAIREKLRRVFAAKNGDHTLFFVADDEAPYGAAMEAMDLARAGGALPIAILTEKPRGS